MPKTNFGQAVAPRAAKGIGNQHRNIDAGQLLEARSERGSGRVGIFGKENRAVIHEAIGFVDTGIGADPSRASFNDEDSVIHAHDAAGLAQYQFNSARVFIPASGETACQPRRLDTGQVNDAAFGL